MGVFRPSSPADLYLPWFSLEACEAAPQARAPAPPSLTSKSRHPGWKKRAF